MISRVKLLSIIVSVFVFSALNAQSGQEVLDTGTVKQQIEYVVKKSYDYNEFEVIKKTWVNKLKKNILDTLAKSQKELVHAYSEIDMRDEDIDSARAKITDLESQLATVTKEKNSISFFGVLVAKSVYNSITWGIIITLISIVAILFILFKRSNTVTRSTRSDLDELKEEYEAHRKRSREREEKMARKHLDEVLKYKNQQGASFPQR
jgi:preprotein translocase subunit SecF